MGKKSKRFQDQRKGTPKPAELLGGKSDTAEQTAEVPEPVAKVAEEAKAEATAEPKAEAKVEASTLEQMVANLPEAVRGKAMEELQKLRVQAERNEAAKAYVAFDEALKDEAEGLPKLIGELAKKHGVDLTGRRITITYPDGKFAYTNSPKGKGKGGGNGREGFPQPWGKAELRDKAGKVKETAPSPCKLAEVMGLQVEGMRDMKDVWNNPHERGTKAELPKRYKVEAVRGEYFRVIETS